MKVIFLLPAEKTCSPPGHVVGNEQEDHTFISGPEITTNTYDASETCPCSKPQKEHCSVHIALTHQKETDIAI